MLLDGVGLAIIAGCTILEGIALWKEYFQEYAEWNVAAICFWLCGRASQVVGLLLLISHAASLQVVHELEQMGMMMLTCGPILNMCACSIFDSGADPAYFFNKQWMASECLEFFGIFLLDLSMMDVKESIVLTFEVIGFFVLGCAAMLDFDYSGEASALPSVSYRMDLVHVTDCCGLFMLTVVACAQYRIKMSAAKLKGHQQQSSSSSHHGQMHHPAGSSSHHQPSRIGTTTNSTNIKGQVELTHRDNTHHAHAHPPHPPSGLRGEVTTPRQALRKGLASQSSTHPPSHPNGITSLGGLSGLAGHSWGADMDRDVEDGDAAVPLLSDGVVGVGARARNGSHGHAD